MENIRMNLSAQFLARLHNIRSDYEISKETNLAYTGSNRSSACINMIWVTWTYLYSIMGLLIRDAAVYDFNELYLLGKDLLHK